MIKKRFLDAFDRTVFDGLCSGDVYYVNYSVLFTLQFTSDIKRVYVAYRLEVPQTLFIGRRKIQNGTPALLILKKMFFRTDHAMLRWQKFSTKNEAIKV